MSFSNREQNILAEMVLNLLVAVYYAFIVLTLPADPTMQLKALSKAVIVIIIFSIVVSVVVFPLINRFKEPEPMDERDYMISARAYTLGYYGFIILLAAMAVYIFLFQGETGLFEDRVQVLSPLMLANLMLGIIVVVGIIKSGYQLLIYRKGL